jgi:hypothetical protein
VGCNNTRSLYWGQIAFPTEQAARGLAVVVEFGGQLGAFGVHLETDLVGFDDHFVTHFELECSLGDSVEDGDLFEAD